MRLTKKSETTIEGNGGRERSRLREWFAVNGMNLAVLPYFAAVWGFTTYADEVATPWTIGWIILWLIYSPIITWTGVRVIGGAWPFATACIVTLVVATPFWPGAIWMLVTMFVSAALGVVYQLWIALALFVAIVASIWIWYHGGIGL